MKKFNFKNIICLLLALLMIFSLAACSKKEPSNNTENTLPEGLKEGDVIHKDVSEMNAFYKDMFSKQSSVRPASTKWMVKVSDGKVLVTEVFISKNEKYSFLATDDESISYSIISTNNGEYLMIKKGTSVVTRAVDDPQRQLVGDVDASKYTQASLDKIIGSDGISNVNYSGSYVRGGILCDVVSFQYTYYEQIVERQFARFNIELRYKGKNYNFVCEQDDEGVTVFGDYPEELAPSDTCVWNPSYSKIIKDGEEIRLAVSDVYDVGFINREGYDPIKHEDKYVLCIDPETGILYEMEEVVGKEMRTVTFNEGLTLDAPTLTDQTKLTLEDATMEIMNILADVLSK